ncbi:sensor histidine kinase [Peptostreptococcus equinus]|uniref:histidine kinase n=1 Tax=Peptostreptococcus equinus TaxID=3003601 RepID=A0ABY7JPV3_9FIRM|nr:HAMP domain-containing sensor histidine kinase [Peptostreptococcus sp. CBA3647]WAW13982.1 HAMP domain-containing sensor histidine kinase [Peptostreptococcus sp. CBA3647]
MINNNVFAKTQKKIIINIMFLVELFMIIMSIFIYSYFKSSILSTIDNSLLDEYRFVHSVFTQNSIRDPIVLQDPKDIVYIYEDDQIRYYTQNRYFDQSIPKNIQPTKENLETLNYNGYSFRTYTLKEGKYTFKIMRNIDSEMESLSHLIVLLIISDIISLLLVYVIAKYLASKTLKPIEQSWNKQIKFVQDASHELRTPVTIIQSKLESLLKSPESTVEDEAETIATAMREARQLKKMISELLSLSKEESIVKVNNEKINIKELFSDIFESYSEIAEYQNKGFSYSVNMKNNIIVSDRTKLTQLLRILVDNAFKYTEPGDSITILANEKTRDRITLEVKDTGVGISLKDQKHIFDRFFRSDAVRAKDIEGSGIGLSIAKLTAGMLKANIKVKSTINQGTSFFIEIPRGRIMRKK